MSCGCLPRWCGGSSPGFAPERRRGRPVPADKAEAVDTGAVLPGPVLRPDSREAREVKPVTIRNAVYGIQRKLRALAQSREMVVWAVRNGLLGD